MKHMLLLGAALFIAAGGLASCSCIDSLRLQGTWEATTTIGNATIVTHQFVADGDTFDFATLTPVRAGRKGTFSISAFSDPREIDLMVSTEYVGEGSLQVVQTHDPAVVVYGIYQVSGDELKIQLGDSANRPAAFDEDAVTLKRVD